MIRIAVTVTCAAAGVVACSHPANSGAPTYYVSADGDDSASGLRPGHAWASLQRATEHDLQPGETIVLTGDRPLRGTLRVTSDDAGDPRNPVRITAEEHFPGIIAEGKAGIDIVDTSGVEVSGLSISVESEAATDGVLVTVSPGEGRREAVTVRDLHIDGAYQGIAVGSQLPGDGYDGVLIDGVTVTGAQRNGIITYGPTAPDYALTDLRIVDSVVTGTRGIPGEQVNTGSGIVIGSVDGAVIEGNESSHNGAQSRAPEGPIGMWTHDSTNVTFRDNVSHHNLSQWTDGGGFGVDISATDILVERNLSHDNYGSGYLAYTHGHGAPTGGVTFRYNASVRDGHTDQLPAGFAILGGLDTAHPEVHVHDIHIHHNTVLTGHSGDGEAPTALLLMGTVSNLRVHHNIFDTSAGPAPAVRIRDFAPEGDHDFSANQLATAPPTPLLDWNGRTAGSVEDLESLLPGTRNLAQAPEFLDPAQLPAGLAVNNPPSVELPRTLPAPAARATADLLGQPLDGAGDAIGAVRPRR